MNEKDLMAALLTNPDAFEYDYRDLTAAVMPETEAELAVEATPETEVPAKIDEEKFAAIFEQYKRLFPDADFDTTKADLIRDPSLFEKTFPALTASVIPAHTEPAVEAKPEIAAEPASIDEKRFHKAIEKYNIYYAAGRESVRPYDFKGAFMLAPMDNNGNLGVNNVPLANLLPSCDGDVNDLAGAASFDHNRFGPDTDTAPRYQILVFGANHNFYNTEWGDDDLNKSDGIPYCESDREGGIRLSRVNQRLGGSFLINSFMRYHVGGEQKFAAYWNGTAQLPDAACPETDGPCDDRIVLTVQKGVNYRKLIAGFERDDSLENNELGGTITLNGFEGSGHYPMVMGGAEALQRSDPARFPDFEYNYNNGQGFQSVADHTELVWSTPGASIITELKGLSAKGTDTLTLRIGVVRPMGQEVLVTLTDSAGKTATITASNFTNALYNAPRPKADDRPLEDHPVDTAFANSGEVKILMNMVAIPLKAFEGIDTNSLKELKLVFPKESGKVAITDIELQNLGREKPEQKLAARQ